MLVRLRVSGVPDTRFAPRGVLRIATPGDVAIEAVLASGSRAVVLAGSAGNAIYVSRYLVGSAAR